MGASVQPDPVAEYLSAKQASAAPAADPVSDYLSAKAHGISQGHDYHAEYASGALGKRMAGANGRDAANLADEQASQPGYGERLATHVLNTAEGIPGMRAVESAAGSLGSKLTSHPASFAESRDALDASTAQIPTGERVAERMAGGLATVPFLPANPALAGATLGGADAALSADSESPVIRALKTAGGATVGALVGKGTDKLIQGVGTGIRALNAPDPAANYLGRLAQRAATAKDLFSSALAEGHSNGITQPVRDFLAEPAIALRVEALQGLDQFKNTPAESPEMLDALHKSLSDEANQIQKGLSVADPGKPNTGRFRAGNVTSLKSRLIDALGANGRATIPAPETAQSPPLSLRDALQNFRDRQTASYTRNQGTVEQQMTRQALERHSAERIVQPPLTGAPSASVVATPPMMPTYQFANQNFAKQSGDIDALGTGMTASRTATKPGRPTFKQISSKDPKTVQSLAEWAQKASPSQLQAATEGVLGDVKNAFHEPGKTLAPFRRAVDQSPAILRALKDRPQAVLDLIKTGSLAVLNGPASP